MQNIRKFYLVFEIISILLTIFFYKLNKISLFSIFLTSTFYYLVAFILPKIPVFFTGLIAFIMLFIFMLTITYTHIDFEIPGKYIFSINYFYIYILVIFILSILTLIDFEKFNILNIISGICLMCLFFIFLYFSFNNRINVVNYSIETNKIMNKDIKIALLSDTHSTIYPNNDLVNDIKREKPDLILLTGDIIDDVASIKGTDILMEKIKDIAPIYYCTGNHEYMAKDYEERIKSLESYGVNYLNDEYKIIDINGNKILISGVNDPYIDTKVKNYPSISDRLKELEIECAKEDFNGVKILLSHRPELYDLYSNYDYDLVLSGHAHGGQVRIPFLMNGLIAPKQGLFPKFAGGLYTLNDKTKMIVSRGLSIEALPRIFDPPELVIITLK
ncbi:MAG: metallophosphoesterase [Oscillospiraceae bacterium]|nr:metallophosphoesterase [Oscillospiraceae bacterium]